MKTWTTAFALLAAGTLVAGPAFAQTTAPSGEQKSKAKSDSSTTTKSDSMKSSDMKSPDSGMKSSDSMKSARSGKGGMAGGGNTEQVRAVQQALKDKGHDPGEVDGKMGPKTQAALRDFQSKEGLKASGRLDAETMTKLGVEAKSSAAGASSTPSASTGSGSSTPSASPSSSPSSSSSGATSGSGASSTPGATDTKK